MAIDSRQKALWLYELLLNGFVILRSFLPLDLVQDMYEQIWPLYLGERAKVESGDTSTLRMSNRMSFDIRPYVDHLKGPLDDDRFRRNPVIEELASEVLGRWRYGVTKVECPLKDAGMMPWHPDVPNDQPRGRLEPVRSTRLTFNVPLVDVTDSNGPMEVIPGSHRMHHYGARAYIYGIPKIYSVKVLLNRTDAMLRDGNLLHRGTPNMTDQPRILLDQTYRALEE